MPAAETATPARTVLLVERHPLIRAGLRALLAEQDFATVAAEASGALDAVAACRAQAFDIALVGQTLDDLDLLAAVEALSRPPRAPALVVCYDRLGPDEIERLLRGGVRGLVSRADSPGEIVEALRTVAGGGVHIAQPDPKAAPASYDPPLVEGGLSRRQSEVLRLLGLGFSNKDVANLLKLSVRTVETHRLNLRQRSGASRPHELRRLAQRLGLLDEETRGARAPFFEPAGLDHAARLRRSF